MPSRSVLEGADVLKCSFKIVETVNCGCAGHHEMAWYAEWGYHHAHHLKAMQQAKMAVASSWSIWMLMLLALEWSGILNRLCVCCLKTLFNWPRQRTRCFVCLRSVVRKIYHQTIGKSDGTVIIYYTGSMQLWFVRLRLLCQNDSDMINTKIKYDNGWPAFA